MLRFLSLILIVFISCATTDESNIELDDIPNGQIDFQKMIIAQLSGERPIKVKGGNDISIKGRWDDTEKHLTRAYLKQIIRQIGIVPQENKYSLPNTNFAIDLLIEPLSGSNLYAILPSTSASNEYVVIGAHYDTGGKDIPGAIDNGSGIAVILSVFRKALQLENRSKNLIVVFFDQEEEGISAGSIAFAKYLNSTDFDIHSVHTFDMIGWDSDNNKEVELELPTKEIEALYAKHASILSIPVYSTMITSSDHYSFIKAGMNAVGVSQAYAKGDNSGKKDTQEDKYPLVNFDYVASSSNLAYEVIKELIND